MPPLLNLQPTITGNLLSITPLTPSHLEPLYKVASDPLIWEQHPFPKHERNVFNEFFDIALNSKGAIIITDIKTNVVIGTSRYYNPAEDEVFSGYTFLARSHWGGTYNRELKQLMLGHAFKFVSKVYFDIGEQNLRSRRAIEKIGASFVKNQEIKGKPYTLYCIEKSDYERDFCSR